MLSVNQYWIFKQWVVLTIFKLIPIASHIEQPDAANFITEIIVRLAY